MTRTRVSLTRVWLLWTAERFGWRSAHEQNQSLQEWLTGGVVMATQQSFFRVAKRCPYSALERDACIARPLRDYNNIMPPPLSHRRFEFISSFRARTSHQCSIIDTHKKSQLAEHSSAHQRYAYQIRSFSIDSRSHQCGVFSTDHPRCSVRPLLLHGNRMERQMPARVLSSL